MKASHNRWEAESNTTMTFTTLGRLYRETMTPPSSSQILVPHPVKTFLIHKNEYQINTENVCKIILYFIVDINFGKKNKYILVSWSRGWFIFTKRYF